MRVLLVSTRGGPEARTWWQCAADQSVRLQAEGHAVTWMQLMPADQVVPEQQLSVNIRRIESPEPGFTEVEAQLADVPGELALSQELRQDPPDVVHFFGYGNCGSASMPWLCARLGVPSIVSLDLREALCHRGTLIDATGEPCTRWDDPQRCLDCCLVPVGAGLTPAQAALARVLRFLGALSPYPSLPAFQNRADIIIAGLAFAQSVIVTDADAADTLSALGVARKLIRVNSEPGDQSWLEMYAAVMT